MTQKINAINSTSSFSSSSIVGGMISYLTKRIQRYLFLLKKAFTMNLQPTEETFPELYDIIVWFRFMMAIGYGRLIGRNKESSAIFLLQSLNIIGFIPILYIRLFLNMNESNMSSSSYGNKLFFAGLLNAIALVLLIWIYYFTLYHAEEETMLSAMLVNTTIVNDTTTTTSSNDQVVEEQEF